MNIQIPQIRSNTLEEWIKSLIQRLKVKEGNITLKLEVINQVFLLNKESNEMYFIGDQNG